MTTDNAGAGGGGNCAVYRWIDPDAAGSGVSGPPNATAGYTHYINNNSNPMGGPTGGEWSNNNCGLNDEPFSFHPGGCNSVFADGSVHFLSETIAPKVMRAMVSRAEGDSGRKNSRITFSSQPGEFGGNSRFQSPWRPCAKAASLI